MSIFRQYNQKEGNDVRTAGISSSQRSVTTLILSLLVNTMCLVGYAIFALSGIVTYVFPRASKHIPFGRWSGRRLTCWMKGGSH